MEIRKMNNPRQIGQTHKEIALEFLSDANLSIGDAIDVKIIEQIYDLFANEKPESMSFQRGIEKILAEVK